ncbi:MAG: hypothetical protein JOZ17_09690 [Acetobacteraceae bacterium]|nr:hypothetical protein [Acetobacteraceae bacterium]
MRSSLFSGRGGWNVCAAGVLVSALTALQASAAVPVPSITGPIPGDTPGSPDHNYTFLSTDIPLAAYGYVEQEFFMSGTATLYSNVGPAPGGVGSSPVQAPTGIPSGYAPYNTNLVVYRPASAANFNGTAILEWANVTNGYNVYPDWNQAADYFINNGYAVVEVSAQRNGIQGTSNALVNWSPIRYGTLDVTDGGVYTHDELAYSIFSQAARAVRNNAGNVIGGLPIKHVIAAGTSQSAGWLSVYANALQPVDNMFDAILLRVGGELIRADLTIPVFKLLSESEFDNPSSDNEIPVLQPDRNGGRHGAGGFRIWQVAGTSHSDYWNALQAYYVRMRDLGVNTLANTCNYPDLSRIPMHYAIDAAYSALIKWAHSSVPPPHSPSIQLVSTTPPQSSVDIYGPDVARDSYGNAIGGIRLPEMQVPTALNTGTNTGPALCFLDGTYIPFTSDVLSQLYPTHQDYVSKFAAAAIAVHKQGFLVRAEMSAAIAAAQEASVPR